MFKKALALILTFAMLLCISVLLSACATSPSATDPADKQSVDLEFSCYELKYGEVQDRLLTIGVEGYLFEDPELGTSFLLNIHLPDDCQYGCASVQEPCALVNSTYNHLPYIAMPLAFVNSESDAPEWGHYAVSIDDGYFFLEFPDDDHYLIGSIHSDTTAQTVLDYFQDFISLLTINGSGMRTT